MPDSDRTLSLNVVAFPNLILETPLLSSGLLSCVIIFYTDSHFGSFLWCFVLLIF